MIRVNITSSDVTKPAQHAHCIAVISIVGESKAAAQEKSSATHTLGVELDSSAKMLLCGEFSSHNAENGPPYMFGSKHCATQTLAKILQSHLKKLA